MPQSIDLPGNALVAMSRDSLLTLRSSLFREMGPGAAALLQEAGFVGGPALYAAFSRWLADRGYGAPESLSAASFGEVTAGFFREAGWGSFDFGELKASVATLDSVDWAEGDPAHPLDFPGCYYSSGVLADFFGRLAGEPLAVMEVECRSMGSDRCRFLIGGGELMQRIYDEMGRGVSYGDAI